MENFKITDKKAWDELQESLLKDLGKSNKLLTLSKFLIGFILLIIPIILILNIIGIIDSWTSLMVVSISLIGLLFSGKMFYHYRLINSTILAFLEFTFKHDKE